MILVSTHNGRVPPPFFLPANRSLVLGCGLLYLHVLRANPPVRCRETVWENVSCWHLPLAGAKTQQVYEDSTATVAKVRRMDGVQRARNSPAAGGLRPNSESGPRRKATPRGSHPARGRPGPRWLCGVCKLFPVSSRNLQAVFADQHGPFYVSDHSGALADPDRRPLR